MSGRAGSCHRKPPRWPGGPGRRPISAWICEDLDYFFGNAGILRYTRAGRNHDARWLQPFELLERHFVVAEDSEFFTQLAEILYEVVGERVVVIDDDDH